MVAGGAPPGAVPHRPPLAARGILLSLFGASASAAANIAVLAVAVREFGPGPVGQYALLLAAAGVVGVLESALTVMTTQRVAGRRGTTAYQTAPGRAARWVGAWLLVLTGSAGGALLVSGVDPAPALGLVGGLGAATALLLSTAGRVGRAQAEERFGIIGAAAAAAAGARIVLVLVLLPHWGVGALGAAALVAALVSRLPVVAATSRTEVPPSAGSVLATLRESRAFLALGVSGQLLMLSDLVVIGALQGTAATGLYRLGAAAPMATGGLLLRAFEALVPRLAADDDDGQERLARRAGGALAATAGLGFGALAGLAEPVTRVLIGEQNDVAATVVVVLCAVYVLDSAVHLPVLLTVARGGEGRLARLVPAELGINLVATAALVLLMGPVGAALGTLVATAALDLVLFPLSPARGSTPVRQLWTHGMLPAAATALAGLIIGRATAGWVAGDLAAILTAGLIIAALWLAAAAGLTHRARSTWPA